MDFCLTAAEPARYRIRDTREQIADVSEQPVNEVDHGVSDIQDRLSQILESTGYRLGRCDNCFTHHLCSLAQGLENGIEDTQSSVDGETEGIGGDGDFNPHTERSFSPDGKSTAAPIQGEAG